VLWGHRENAGTYQCRAGGEGCRWPRREGGDFCGHEQAADAAFHPAAEEKLGELSQQTINAVRQAMAKARAADSAGDGSACASAIAEVQRAIGP
jgi:hypothetical protein